MLTILIIICSKYSTHVGRLLGSNPIAMLATIILLSYTKLLQVCQGILSYQRVMYSNETSITLWKLDPTVQFFKGKHTFIAAFAICVLIFFLVPYTFLLLFGYHLQSCSSKRGFRWFNKFKPLLDAYYAPYHSTSRYWPGFLLIVRVCILISYTVSVENESQAYLIIETLLLSSMAFLPWTCNEIYEKRYLNMLEASFMINIITLASGTLYNKKVNGNQLLLSQISVGVALAEFFGIVLFHVFFRLRSKTIFQKWNATLTKNLGHKLMKRNFKAKEIELKESLSLRTTVVDFREPLLETLTVVPQSLL